MYLFRHEHEPVQIAKPQGSYATKPQLRCAGSSAHEVHDECHYGEQKQDMDESACHMENANTQHPGDQQNHKQNREDTHEPSM